MSALRSTLSGRAVIDVTEATPMLAVTNTSPWPMAIGSRKIDWILSANGAAESSVRLVGSTTTNSSPDSRATIASAGTTLTRRWATMTSNSSPASWPT